MNTTFALQHYGKPGGMFDDIELRDAQTKCAWGRLHMPEEGQHWQLKVGQRTIDTLTASRDSAFFLACGVRLGGDNG